MTRRSINVCCGAILGLNVCIRGVTGYKVHLVMDGMIDGLIFVPPAP